MKSARKSNVRGLGLLPWLLIGGAAALLSGCGVHGLEIPQSPLLKLFVARSGHIAYIGTDGNLYLADQSGKQTRLTNDAQGAAGGMHVSYVSPTWGPSGERIAYARYLTDPTNGKSTVQFHVLNWRSKKNLTSFTSDTLSPFYFDWSPNGHRIAVLSDAGGGNLEFGIVIADKSDSYQKMGSGSPYYWTWSRDGKEIISHSDFSISKPGQVSVIPVAEPSKRIALQDVFGPFQAPSVLPGGAIVAVVGTGADARLATVDPTSGAATPLAAPHDGGFLFSVSPNGKDLAYLEAQIAQGQATSTLHVVNLATKKEVVTLTGESAVAYYWSPDSSKIAFFTPAASAAKIGSAFAQVRSLPLVNLKVVEVRGGKSWNIATFPLTRGLLSTFPFTDQYQQSQTIWSPNSRYLLFTAYTSAGVPGVFVANVNGNVGPSKVADGDSAVWSWK